MEVVPCRFTWVCGSHFSRCCQSHFGSANGATDVFAALISLCPQLVPLAVGVLLYVEFRDGAVSKLFGQWE